MAVGRPIDKQTIDNQIASFGIQLGSLFSQIQQYTKTLDGVADSVFTTTGIQKSQSDSSIVAYSSAELTSLRNAYRDLNKFSLVYTGSYYVTAGATVNAGVPTANDGTHFGYPFSLNVGLIDGLGY